ncbi:MAG: hypothetical protein M3169_00030 [Candidatus Eremiobacteraeota bacterium]|nr:hypothetical protein [Candidatus Eremiobacteraeota bacterium]
MIRRLCAVALLVLAASCGHKDTQSSTSTTTVQTPSAAAPMGAAATGGPAAGAGNGSSSGAGNPPGFSDEASAKAHCATDEVVWLNTRSKIYHEKGTHYYGITKNGEYACRKEADAAGDRNSKS